MKIDKLKMLSLITVDFNGKFNNRKLKTSLLVANAIRFLLDNIFVFTNLE